jgi:hypothetical protein
LPEATSKIPVALGHSSINPQRTINNASWAKRMDGTRNPVRLQKAYSK